MGTNKPLTPEMVRILRACRDGHLKLDIHKWRWYIDGAEPPATRDRKLLKGRSLLADRWTGKTYEPFLTPRGVEALADIEAHEHPLAEATAESNMRKGNRV